MATLLDSDTRYSNDTNPTVDSTGADLLVAIFDEHGSAAITGVLDSKGGNTWHALTAEQGSARHTIQMFWCTPVNTGVGHAVTPASGGANGTWTLLAFSGSTASPFDVQNGHYNNDTVGPAPVSLTPGSATPSTADSVAIAAYAIDDPTNTGTPPFAVDSGFSIATQLDVIPGSNHGMVTAVKMLTSTAAVNPTLTRSSVNTQLGDAAVIAVFKAVSSGPTPANANASIPITLGFSATAKAIAKATATIAIALGATCAASAPAKLSASAPITIGVSATARAPAQVAASIPISLGLAATARAPAQVAASIPIALGAESTAIALAKANAAIPISIGVTAAAKSTLVNVASISIPLHLGVVSTSRARATAAVSVPIALTVAGQLQAPAHATARITISLGVVAHASSGNAFIPARSPTQFVVSTHPRTIAIATRPRLFVFTIVPRTIHFDD
jgi:hypothetical protein